MGDNDKEKDARAKERAARRAAIQERMKKQQKLKKTILMATLGLLGAALIVLVIGKLRGPAKTTTVVHRNALAQAREDVSQAKKFFEKASRAGSPQERNRLLDEAIKRLRKAIGTYRDLIAKNPEAESRLNAEAQKAQQLLYKCNKFKVIVP